MFGKNPGKQAQAEAAKAEIDRLGALTPDALAIEVLPTLGSDEGKKHASGLRIQEISKGLLSEFHVPMTVNPGVLLLPIKEALQRLEHANLVMQMASNVDNASRWRITTTGEQTLANGSVAQKLA